MNKTQSVLDRYSEAALQVQENLCCPIDYEQELLQLLPEEIITKDYGCGNPSRYIETGDTVLDLGSGGGKIAYMAAQLVGEQGQVIGVDINDDMLALAKKYQAEMAEKIGGDRVKFVKAWIQNLALDLDYWQHYLQHNPVENLAQLQALNSAQQQQCQQKPVIADNSIDLVLSNCVLNLVEPQAKTQLFEEMFRVVKPGGRVAISDIVSNQVVPEHLMNNAELWSGCISGAFELQNFLQAFKAVGFHQMRIDQWQAEPWQVIEGIEFRSVTVVAYKPVEATDKEYMLLYKGPYSVVMDDFGQSYYRGQLVEVSEQSYQLNQNNQDFIAMATSQIPEMTKEKRHGCCA